ncbi:MAG: electron transport complex subunit RsxG [Magnetococcales bacterium]|nr:electron transport complex subunit RsxG [Magnetococcales bacterium]NGZ25447.1 electron transport complex subunit RsxG [Magnetococcales bacterium]
MPDFIKMGVFLMVVGAIATALLAYTNDITQAPIAEAKRQETMQSLRMILPAFDNEPDRDTRELIDGSLNKKQKPVTFFRAKKDGQDVGVAFMVTAPDGYSGDIDIMMGMDTTGTLTGIRVVGHKETPGLGDKIVITQWPESFKGKNATNIRWAVKKDGGDFDQFAGATITPRAVVKAVKRGIDYFNANQQKIFQRGEK